MSSVLDPPSLGTPPFPHRIRILAVDDRPENLVALEAALADTGFDLVTCLSGPEALRLVREGDFAILLLDVQMPGMDGFETARLLRQIPNCKNLPVIFITAIHRSEPYERTGYVSGAVDFLFKPLDTDILLAKIGVFAELHRAKLENQRLAEIAKEQALKEQEVLLLKRAVEVRDDFLSIASHELNTPITPLSLQMQSFLKMIRDGRLKEMDTARLQRMLEIAFGQVERLSRLIRELVDVSRISSGRFGIEPARVRLRDIAETVVAEFAEEIRQMGCDVRIVENANPVGLWDRVRIEQVLINLLSNAMKYGLGRPVRIVIDGDNSRAVLKIEDKGIGISSEDRARIFERFERAVSSHHYGGLGLGLFITQEIVRLHQGSITLDSDLGQGSTFTVELPALPN